MGSVGNVKSDFHNEGGRVRQKVIFNDEGGRGGGSRPLPKNEDIIYKQPLIGGRSVINGAYPV